MKLYSGNSFELFSGEHKNKIRHEIESQSENYILNVNLDDYVNFLFQKERLDVPELRLGEIFVDSSEREIPGSRFPLDFLISDKSRKIKKRVIIYHIPYQGDIKLLQLRPNPFVLMTYEVEIDHVQRCMLIEVIDFYNDPVRIKQSFELELNYLTKNYENVRRNCNDFNEYLKGYLRSVVEERKKYVLEKSDLLAALGVPIKQREGVSNTFSVPNPKLKERIVVKPIVQEGAIKPEPALDEENYRRILKIINDVGKNFERMPSTYKGKSEEDIRDHILLVVDPNFELGSAGGETFNKSGKTDISLRYDSSVVFVAECKYWRGEKVLLKTIDQLLNYLTWRNSKVAIVNFVQNVEFSDVMSKVKSTVVKHSNFLSESPNSDRTWFNYKFHLNGDRSRELDLAVISFHLP